LVFIESREGTQEIINQGVSLYGFHDHIIDVSFDQIISDLIGKAVLNSTLVRGSRVLKPKRHSRVAVSAERCNEGRLDLIILVESDMVITRVAIKKGQ
jgi:hypothetical protein